MKNFITYYYNFYIYDIHYLNGNYYFNYNKDKYMFKKINYEIENSIDEIYEINKIIINNNHYYHEIITNKEKSLITYFENQPYVMLKLSNVSKLPISIFDIKGNDYISLSNQKYHKLNKFNWVNYWENKVDYFEEYIENNKKKYSELLASFNYYVGFAENAIMYVNNALIKENKTSDDELVISHRRFNKKMTLMDFYDPTNLIIDHKVRDIAEYLKFLFVNNDYDIILISDYIQRTQLSILGVHLLIGRLLFPSFYFDCLEEVILTNNFEMIYILNDRKDEYRKFIDSIINCLKSRYEISQIDWI